MHSGSVITQTCSSGHFRMKQFVSKVKYKHHGVCTLTSIRHLTTEREWFKLYVINATKMCKTTVNAFISGV